MERDKKHLGLPIDKELHEKLKYIAKYEDRSMNGQIMFLIRECVRAFEQEHGKIDLDE